MKTEILKTDDKSDWELKLKKSIKNNIPFVIPTETVYGLAAFYNNEQMVQNIFKIKNRPIDNPLIVHIFSVNQLNELMIQDHKSLPSNIKNLVAKFWPGPLTILFRKKNSVPDLVTANSEYVGIRMPSHLDVRKILEFTNVPLVAPSANLSGKPSPTNAVDAYEDLNGKVELIFDGGSSEIGLESTVIKLSDDMQECTILRPGKITASDLDMYFEEVLIDKTVLQGSLAENRKVESPGMKYKHYSPNAKVILFENLDSLDLEEADNFYLLCYSKNLNLKNSIYFKNEDELAHNLFSTFRVLDRKKIANIYVELPKENLALKNRLIKAAI